MQKKKFTFIGMVIIALICAGCIIYNLLGNRLTRQLDLGYKYLKEMEYEQALVVFNEILKIEPRNAEGYLGMLEVYISMSDFETALKYAEDGYEMTGDERLKEKADMIKSGNIFSYLGYPMKATFFDEEENILCSLQFTYNRKGQKASVTEFDEKGKQVAYIKLEYDQDGNQLTGYDQTYASGGISLWEAEYKEGLRVKYTKYKDDSRSEIDTTVITEYNDKGKAIKDYKYDSEGKEVSCISMEYDSQEREIRRNWYKENELEQYLVMEYNEKGERKRDVYYDASGTIGGLGIWVYQYDEDGRLIKIMIYDDVDKLRGHFIYEYNEEGGRRVTWKHVNGGGYSYVEQNKTE